MKAAKQETPELGHWDILLIDIAGYSKLDEDQQVAEVKKLTHVVKATQVIYAKKGKPIYLPTGDGMAVCFKGLPEAPLELARQIHESYGKDRYLLKMGIHSGVAFGYEDINGESNIAGSGINMAARVVSCCYGGHILVAADPGEKLKKIGKWKEMLGEPYTFRVKHDEILRAYNLCDAAAEIGLDKAPDRNRVFETNYVPFIRTLAELGVLPSDELRSRKILTTIRESFAVDSFILEDPLIGFSGIRPDRLKLSVTDQPPPLPDYVIRLRDSLPVPEFNQAKVYLAGWKPPLMDAGGFLHLTLGRTDYRTLLAWEHEDVLGRLKDEIEQQRPNLEDFQRRLTCHCIVLTADRRVVLLRRSKAVHWQKLAWSVSFEESMAAELDVNENGLIDPTVTVRRALGKKEELGLPKEHIETADIRFVGMGIEWDNLAEGLCTVVRLPTMESDHLHDLWRGAHDRGEHRAFDLVEFNMENCIKLLRASKHVPATIPIETDRFHRTAKIRILAAMFNEFGYADSLSRLQEISANTGDA